MSFHLKARRETESTSDVFFVDQSSLVRFLRCFSSAKSVRLLFCFVSHVRIFERCSDLVDADGLFFMQRIGNSCSEINVNVNADPQPTDNCLIYNWSQIINLTTSYTTYKESNSNNSYNASIGALTVLGRIENYTLNYECPPLGYNGAGPGCVTQPNTQLVVLKIGSSDRRLYSIDIILAGVPFPDANSLQDNQPPFGKSQILFTSPIDLRSTGYLKICKNITTNRCPNADLSKRRLPYPLPSNYGYGIFGIKAFNLVTNSTWIMDDLNQLLIVTAGSNYYYFNRTGFFLYDSESKNCIWSPVCDYRCEVYNYNSRFLDYAGEWTITQKWGVNMTEPKVTDIWIGNAIDAAGIFPVIMYTDKVTGHYLGLDKLDPVPAAQMGATYWYGEHGTTKPKLSIQRFSPNVVQANCVSKLSDWTGAWTNDSSKLSSNTSLSMMFVSALLFIVRMINMTVD